MIMLGDAVSSQKLSKYIIGGKGHRRTDYADTFGFIKRSL